MDIELTKPPDADHPEGAVEVTWLNGDRVIVHYEHVPEKDLTVVRGIPCTTALRTVIDVAPDLEPKNLALAIADCLRRRLFSVEEGLARVNEPDMINRLGAQLVRAELLRTN